MEDAGICDYNEWYFTAVLSNVLFFTSCFGYRN